MRRVRRVQLITFLLISCFILLGTAAYYFSGYQWLVKENARLLIDNAALLTKALAKHGLTPLHEPAEVKKARQDQSISLVPPIHAAIAAEEAKEEEEERTTHWGALSEEKKDELRKEAARRAS